MPKSQSIRTGRNSASNFLMGRFSLPWKQLVEQVDFSFPSVTNLLCLSVNLSPDNQLGTLKTPCERVLLASYLPLKYEVTQERLRQARLSFNAALAITTLSATLSLAGIGLLLFGKVPEGIVTTTTGLTSNCVSACCLRLTQEANDRLDWIASEQLESGELIDSYNAFNKDRD